MLIVDTRTNVPLLPERMDWNPDNIQIPSELVAVIPIVDDTVKRAVKSLAYEIAKNQPWTWPDLSRTTVALVADMSSYTFTRFSLKVGAISENGGADAYDSFPVMLTVDEEMAIQAKLCDVLGMY